ncbi:TetR/AcrR family transcriptional regulator [Collimonas sp.]|jgi:TetR/AcrR family transcriptional repressor of uid operon|uniref:TetR/AcrR family transcriptional regulator n=1 Tax=Collimonas sp. TaxID=1963772 RepID=UPI002C3107F8|nr:TetR/AcrR family transcriptional regulator [Collimonas sp.]HWW08542.1 TetR/AcrR family transcriptional regulator [Collimonas sp.]
MAIRKSKTPQSPTQRADQKRVDILKSAGKCFRKTGFHQTSMQEICTEVGLGPGAVYRYFTSKDAIIAAMAEDERRQARTLLSEFHDTDDLPQALSAITRAFARRYAAISDAGLMTEIYAEGLRNKRVGAVIKTAETEWVDGLADMLRTAQERGQIDPALDAQAAALLLTAMWDGIVIRQAYTPELPEAMLTLFDDMLKRWLASSSASPGGSKRAKPTPTPKAVAPAAEPELDLSPAAPAVEKPLTQAEIDLRQMSLI